MPSAATNTSVTATALANWTAFNTAHVPNGSCTCRIRTANQIIYMAFVATPADNIALTPTLGTDPVHEMAAGSVFEFEANPQLIRLKGAAAGGSASIICNW